MKKYFRYFKNCVFAFDSKNNIMEEKELGICSSVAAVLTPESSVFRMRSIQACPYTATSFDFDLRIDGEKLASTSWKWLPNAILRICETEKYRIETLTAVITDGRGAVEKIKIKNKTENDETVTLAALYRGGVRREEEWTFDIPEQTVSKTEDYFEKDGIIGASDGKCAFMITSSLEGLKMFRLGYMWEREITVPAGKDRTFCFSAHIGPVAECESEAKNTHLDYEGVLAGSFEYLEREVDRIKSKLPEFSSDNGELCSLYYRSLVTYILCRWDNPELCVMPYFSTGSVNGSCMCSYLWDYCGGLMMHPLYDSEANKRQILALLKNDLTKSYALNPITSGSVGPWYQVNQEKIILMVYYHVLHTGERELLFEKVRGKTVIEHMREQAYVCDDITKEPELFDYGIGRYETRKFKSGGEFTTWFGEGNSHLELRRGIPYNGIIPDLNARRYMNYMRVYELTRIAGEPDELLPRRALALKEKMKKLWNSEKCWYDFISQGKRDTRFTVQMFKFLNSGVIDEDERAGLVSHLNEREFLSRFGLHSMSKLDTAYDQDDIDNGGGGICTHFTMQICSQLYATGYDKLATDILKRVLWWGTRLPYLGDSCAANLMMNREDTPLQGDISSVSAAQMILFYIFGIKAEFDGNIVISPVAHRPSENMSVKNVKICGKTFSVSVEGSVFGVEYNSKTFMAKIGEAVTI